MKVIENIVIDVLVATIIYDVCILENPTDYILTQLRNFFY